jgi:cell shape-determining protein MreC
LSLEEQQYKFLQERETEVENRTVDILRTKNAEIKEKEDEISSLNKIIEKQKEKYEYEFQCANNIAIKAQSELKDSINTLENQFDELKTKYKKANADIIEKHKIITTHLNTIEVI